MFSRVQRRRKSPSPPPPSESRPVNKGEVAKNKIDEWKAYKKEKVTKQGPGDCPHILLSFLISVPLTAAHKASSERKGKPQRIYDPAVRHGALLENR